jgi:peptidoglycan/LPS O-acetylase OafA/YrhL
VEEWFYIFLPLASLTFFRKGIQPKYFLIFVLSFIGFFFLARFLWNYFEKGVVLYQFDCLLLGVLLATLKKHYNKVFAKLAGLPIALCGLIGVILLVNLMGNMGTHGIYDTFYKVTWYFLLSFCISAILSFVESSRWINVNLASQGLLNRCFTWTSILSYSLYLLHPSFYKLTFDLPLLFSNTIMFVLLFLTAFFLFIIYERPFMNLRDGFSFRAYLCSIKVTFNK